MAAQLGCDNVAAPGRQLGTDAHPAGGVRRDAVDEHDTASGSWVAPGARIQLHRAPPTQAAICDQSRVYPSQARNSGGAQCGPQSDAKAIERPLPNSQATSSGSLATSA